MSALLRKSAVLALVWLLFAACGETTPGQRGAQRQDLQTTASVEATGEGIAARIEGLETRLAALERRVTQLGRLRGLPTGAALFREGNRLPAAQTARQAPAQAGSQAGEAVKQSAGPGQAVDFTNAAEGQIFPQYGSRNMIIKTSAGLALTSASQEPVNLVFSDFSLAGRIEVIVSLRTGFWTDQQIRLLNDDRPLIAVTLSNYDLKFGDYVKKRSTTGWKRGEERNQLRIVIDNDNAWLYINKQFFGVQEIEFAKANRLEISGIKRDQDFVYSISVQPLS
ncbi:MAG: hypothetical protein WAN46_06540 [Gammaproteobacteria bacterium]|jgi:hypothetical protein